jgi:hypothetical protein
MKEIETACRINYDAGITPNSPGRHQYGMFPGVSSIRGIIKIVGIGTGNDNLRVGRIKRNRRLVGKIGSADGDIRVLPVKSQKKEKKDT